MAKVAFTAPHHQAAQAGLAVLEKGGHAVDAMIAAAASVSAVYPHMTGLGGDGFWLIQSPGEKPVAIDASGWSAGAADLDFYRDEETIPSRGPKAAIDMAGAVSGWEKARQLMTAKGFSNWPLQEVLQSAIFFAEQGIDVTESLADASALTYENLKDVPGFAEVFLPDGQPLKTGETFKNSGLANLLKRLAEDGLNGFYQGDIADAIGAFLSRHGSPVQADDLNQYQAVPMEVLSTKTTLGTLYNVGAPTQGLASLLILALYDKLYQPDWGELDKVHHLVECTKQAFLIRDAQIADVSRVTTPLEDWLSEASLNTCLDAIQPNQAMPWPKTARPGDTVWMGAVDQHGVMVSYIQSLYWEFGSGVTIPEFGLVWNNRGTSFSLDETSLNALAPNKKPFHTLNPAMCEFYDGRRMVYGTMGGEGQPQTQAALYMRYAYDEKPLAAAIAEDRWLLGRTWGDQQNDLKLEAGLAERLGDSLQQLGHQLQTVPSLSEKMGHAGAIVLSGDGQVDSASDPRSDGAGLTGEVH
ncbi:gamma-glutamyltransferase [Thiomicrospira sp. XS5]|uniref:gamma-glutamyltransferase family protein n=1 Tax=Thiomicrospira sp. XS5 TaxID=1775636 RepID=UPI00074891D4|nr:gamma-glutamyltransferase [Thiomicrospira sp. XS5]KUJ75583.1 gamma-glutamyltransferase [Thiomicrospira sp. XS5]